MSGGLLYEASTAVTIHGKSLPRDAYELNNWNSLRILWDFRSDPDDNPRPFI
jgi:hypothetical protein